VPDEPKRRSELLQCLWAHLHRREIDQVILVTDAETIVPYYSEKLTSVVLPIAAGQRPTFAHLVDAVESQSAPEDLRVIANADIDLDANIDLLRDMHPDQFIALGRHERINNRWTPVSVSYSQDVWAWRGPCLIPRKKLDFAPGTVACDNVLAYVAHEAGYEVANPCQTIKARHRHADWEKTHSALQRLPPPYMYVHPHALGGRIRRQLQTDYAGPADASGPVKMVGRV